MGYLSSILFFLNFYWSIVDLQYCWKWKVKELVTQLYKLTITSITMGKNPLGDME